MATNSNIITERGITYCTDKSCGDCWYCRGDEPPMVLLPNPDAPPAPAIREIEAGYAEAEAAFAAYEAGLIDNPYALLGD